MSSTQLSANQSSLESSAADSCVRGHACWAVDSSSSAHAKGRGGSTVMARGRASAQTPFQRREPARRNPLCNTAAGEAAPTGAC
eukprot:1405042-Prymnesium_polylepis.1